MQEASAEPDGAEGAAVQSLSTILRDFGHFAFDTDLDAAAVDSACDRWARHLLYGSECPRAAWTPEGGALQDRDWTGMRHAFLEQRQREYGYVMRSVGGMRSAIWSFVHELQQSLSDTRRDDEATSACLRRLDAASRGDSVDSIRREVAATSVALTRMIALRKKRESDQVEELRRQLDSLGSELEEAKQTSMLDPLTGLYNRKALDIQLQRAIDVHTVFGNPTCLLLVDADHFKQINDTHGHTSGDRVLLALADCLTHTFPRKSDVVARYGGEEFAVIVTDVSGSDGMKLAERLLAAVRRIRLDSGLGDIVVTVSIGVAVPRAGDTVETWIQRADRALYGAKAGGRDRSAFGS